MIYTFTIVVPSKRFIEITHDFKISVGSEIAQVVPVRSAAGHVIGYNCVVKFIDDFKKACRFETRLQKLGYEFVISKKG